MSEALTARQREVLDAVRDHLLLHQRPPTIRELGAAIGVKSNNGVSDHLKALERKGRIARDQGTTRGIRVLRTE